MKIKLLFILVLTFWCNISYSETVTLYFRSDQHTINGLVAYKLLAANSSSSGSFSATQSNAMGSSHEWWSSIYIRHANSSETTLGTVKAYHNESLGLGNTYYEFEETWESIKTLVVSTDAIKIVETVRVNSSVSNTRTFITEQLGFKGTLNVSTWTFHKHGQAEGWQTGWPPQGNMRTSFHHGDTTYNSNVSGIEYTPGGYSTIF